MITAIAVLIVTVLLMAFFCGSEIGLISCQKPRIANMVKNGSRRAAAVKYILDRPGLMLATMLVGTNICTVCASLLAKQVVLEAGVKAHIAYWGTALVLPLLLLFPEIVPKNWFRQAPARRSVFFAPLLLFVFVILYPAAKLIALFTGLLTRLLGRPQEGDEPAWLMRNDFRYLIRDSENAGVIDSGAADILDRSLTFHQLRVKDVMTPLAKVVQVTATTTVREAAELCRRHKVSLLPVMSKRGEYIGIFSIYKAIFTTNEKTWNKLIVTVCMHQIHYLAADCLLPEVIAAARRHNCRLLGVKDDKGNVIGIVTPGDVSGKLFV
ncbi:MAG: CNNM domain-containing protein [Victivallaceae bacterium]|nr:CNNM domain-containing protein [Victivallaceae bacterium]